MISFPPLPMDRFLVFVFCTLSLIPPLLSASHTTSLSSSSIYTEIGRLCLLEDARHPLCWSWPYSSFNVPTFSNDTVGQSQTYIQAVPGANNYWGLVQADGKLAIFPKPGNPIYDLNLRLADNESYVYVTFSNAQGNDYWCASTREGRIECSGGFTAIPDSALRFIPESLRLVKMVGCGLLKENATLYCWGTFPSSCPRSSLPIGQVFRQWSRDCGLTPDGELVCNACSFNTTNPTDPTHPLPNDRFIWIDSYVRYQTSPTQSWGCGILMHTLQLKCWKGRYSTISNALLSFPSGEYIQLSVTLDYACAIKKPILSNDHENTFSMSEALVCWGEGSFSKTLFPGPFMSKNSLQMYGSSDYPVIDAIDDLTKRVMHWGYTYLNQFAFPKNWNFNQDLFQSTVRVNTFLPYMCGLTWPLGYLRCDALSSLSSYPTLWVNRTFHQMIGSSMGVIVIRQNDSHAEGFCMPIQVCSFPISDQTPAIDHLFENGWATVYNNQTWMDLIGGQSFPIPLPPLNTHLQIVTLHDACALWSNGTVRCLPTSSSWSFINTLVPISLVFSDFDLEDYSKTFCGILSSSQTIQCWTSPVSSLPLAFAGLNALSLQGYRFSSIQCSGLTCCGQQEPFGTVFCFYSPFIPFVYSTPLYEMNFDLSLENTCENGTYRVREHWNPLTSLCTGKCMPGYYSKQTQTWITPLSSSCDAVCPPGHYCEEGSTHPIECPPGVFGFTNQLSVSSCNGDCIPGFYCPSGTVFPLACPQGSYGNSYHLSTIGCNGLCPPGYFCPPSTSNPFQYPCTAEETYCEEGSSLPVLVPFGFYRKNSSLIQPCELGHACTSGQPRECLQGTFQNTTRQSFCYSCVHGTYQSLQGQSQCLSCHPGLYSNYDQASFCFSCPPGSYQPFVESSECWSCSVGTFQAQSGQTQCIDCNAGFYSSSNGSKECLPCPIGTYSNFRSSSCSPCDPGHESNPSKSACDLCPTGTVRSSKMMTCQLCPDRSYASWNHIDCLSCSELDGLECSLGVATLKGGYWLYWDQELQSLQTWPCTNPKACPPIIGLLLSNFSEHGRLNIHMKMNLFANNENNENNENINTFSICEKGRDPSTNNVLCGKCQEDYSEWNGKCVPCKSTHAGWVTLVLVLGVLYWIGLVISSQGVSSIFGIYLYYIQMCMLMIGSLLPLLSWLQLFNFAPQEAGVVNNSDNNINENSQCPFPWSPYEKFYWMLCTPFLFLGMTLFCGLLIKLWTRFISSTKNTAPDNKPTTTTIELNKIENKEGPTETSNSLPVPVPVPVPGPVLESKQPSESEQAQQQQQQQQQDQKNWSWMDRWIRVLLCLALFTYTQITEQILRFLHCISIGPYHVIASLPAIECRNMSWWLQLLPILALFIGIVIGIPCLIFKILWPRRKAIENRQDQEFASWCNLLYMPYHSKRWYYSIVILIRRTIFASLLFIQNDGDRFLAFGFFHVASLALHWLLSPFALSLCNSCETASHFLLICVSVLLSRQPDLSQASDSTQAGLFCLLVVPTIAFLGLYFYRLIQCWKRRHM